MKTYLILFSSLFIAFTVVAQTSEKEHEGKDHSEMHEQIQNLLIAHITKEIELTTGEAQQFWPAYNAMRKERRAAEKEKKALMKEIVKGYDQMTENEATDYLDQYRALEQRIADANYSQNHEKIIQVIGVKRFFKLQKAEMDFRREMLRKYKNRGKSRDKRKASVEDLRDERKSEYQNRRDALIEKRDSLKASRKS
ncbi:MAG: hypothetical protein WBG46_13805 [Nonlabens sp.]